MEQVATRRKPTGSDSKSKARVCPWANPREARFGNPFMGGARSVRVAWLGTWNRNQRVKESGFCGSRLGGHVGNSAAPSRNLLQGVAERGREAEAIARQLRPRQSQDQGRRQPELSGEKMKDDKFVGRPIMLRAVRSRVIRSAGAFANRCSRVLGMARAEANV